jgi:glycerol-3-phosphate dehydrogenase (NAD(P)+)
MQLSKPKTLVLGAGAWGTALALTLVRNGTSRVSLWGRDENVMAEISAQRVNRKYLPGIVLPDELEITTGENIAADVDVIVAATPFQTLRPVLKLILPQLSELRCIVCAGKGIEKDTFLRADQIVAELVPPDVEFAILSGPNFAVEVAEQRPAATTIATSSQQWGDELVRRFHSDAFRPYSSSDVIGVSIGGALKNVMAIAAGIADGLDLGANSRAALVTRGLAEITRFGLAQGGKLETFMGLSGLGDLILTCTDDKSRNRRFGLRLSAGLNAAQARQEIGLVEGVTTAAAVLEFSDQQHIDLPISREIANTVCGRTTPRQAVKNLLLRDPVAESAGLIAPHN